MKIKIRKSFFETNSSSVHAIIIPNKKTELKRVEGDYYRSGIPNKLELVLDYYGWGEKVLESIKERFGYIFAGLAEIEAYDEILQLLELLDKLNIKLVAPEYNYYSDVKTSIIQTVVNVLEEYKHTKNVKVIGGILKPLVRNDDIGIDHGYEFEKIKENIFSNEEMLIEVLFGDTIIITGNDNEGVMTLVLRLIETHPDYKVLIKGN